MRILWNKWLFLSSRSTSPISCITPPTPTRTIQLTPKGSRPFAATTAACSEPYPESAQISLDKARQGEDHPNLVKSAAFDSLNDRINMSFLVITKAISKEDYKGNQTHIELAARMAKRDPKSHHLGDRVLFIILTGQANARAWYQSEDPIYAMKNGFQIDTKHCLENQLRKPLLRLSTSIMGESKVESLLKGENIPHVKHTPLRIA